MWVGIGDPILTNKHTKKPQYIITVNGKVHIYHRYLMEQHLGRKLKTNEVVHHINHNHLDNRISNLRVMSHGDHSRLHNKGKTRPKTGKNIVCPICGNVFYRCLSRIQSRPIQLCSTKCSGVYHSAYLKKNWSELFSHRRPKSKKFH